MSFDQLGLSEKILQAISEKGYDTPSPIQEKAIPAVLKGNDLMAAAQTGTGKTAGFVLPLLEMLQKKHLTKNNQARTLILTPTRELANQIHENILEYGKHLNLRSAVVYGGVKINPQMMKLRKGVDILVATPGRLLDLYQQKAVRFDDLEVLVLDEADRMLDMGFIRDIKRIMATLPKQRQNLLFSATFSGEIKTFAKSLLRNPVEINVSPKTLTADRVEQYIYPVDKTKKTSLLSHLIKENNWHQVLVFSRTKHGANKLVKILDKKGIDATAIHGNKSQNQRMKALENFKQEKVQVLVATDIAARGIDINQLPHVINFDLPNVSEDYVHRIGRTGRAGSGGVAVSLVSADEIKLLSDIERLIGRHIERQEIAGFEPEHALPASRPITQRTNSPRPKKQKSGGASSGNKPRITKKPTRRGGGSANSSSTSSNSNSNSNKNNNSNNSNKSKSNKNFSNKPKKDVNGNR